MKSPIAFARLAGRRVGLRLLFVAVTLVPLALSTPQPAQAAPGNTRTQVAVQGLDNAVWAQEDNSTASPLSWSITPFGTRGGVVQGPPAVVGYPDPANPANQAIPLYIAVGSDSHLWVRGEGFVSWTRLSSNGLCLETPAAVITREVPVSATQVQLIVSCEGLDHAVWWASEDLTYPNLPAQDSLFNWHTLGGRVIAGPAAAVVDRLTVSAAKPYDKVEFFALGTDSHIWTTNTRQNAVGRVWVRLSMICTGHPAAGSAALSTPVAQAGGTTSPTFVACQGTDRAFWFAISEPAASASQWTGNFRGNGVLVSGPGVGVTPDHAVFAVEGQDGQSWHELYAYSSGSLSGWHPAGGRLRNGSTAGALNSYSNTQ